MSNVIVLSGGNSDEREISLRSGAAVSKALRTAGYEVKTLDPADGLENLLPELRKAEVVFPALHGAGGEDGTLQQFLEDNDVKYVGSGNQASAICFDKAGYAQLLDEHGISTPETELVNLRAFRHSVLARQPFVLKPNNGGSSIDTFIVRNIKEVEPALMETAFDQHKKLLLQTLVEGTEITVAIIGTEALPVIEIIPPEDGEFDYENKYNGQTQELCPPRHVSEATQEQARVLALKIHELTGCRDMSRTDIIITPTDKLYVLETNTIPGLTGESLLPKAAREAGIDMPALCDKLVRLALQRNT